MAACLPVTIVETMGAGCLRARRREDYMRLCSAIAINDPKGNQIIVFFKLCFRDLDNVKQSDLSVHMLAN